MILSQQSMRTTLGIVASLGVSKGAAETRKCRVA